MPRKSDQPTDEQRATLQQWVNGFLIEERGCWSRTGRVVLRRLNNDEYNYSLRDLTGVPTLNPTREFGRRCGGRGFNNAGDAGNVAALVDKFLDAGKEVAALGAAPGRHPFSKYTTERDRADEIMVRIHQFYSRFVNVNRQLGDTWDDPATAKPMSSVVTAASRRGPLCRRARGAGRLARGRKVWPQSPPSTG